jgi:hypothetical protein
MPFLTEVVLYRTKPGIAIETVIVVCDGARRTAAAPACDVKPALCQPSAAPCPAPIETRSAA